MKLRIAALFLLASACALHADMINVHNKTGSKKPIYAAVYCKTPFGSAERKGKVAEIADGQKAQLERGESSYTCRRHLAFSYEEDKLKSKVDRSKFNKLGQIETGKTSETGGRLSSNFYVGDKDGKLVSSTKLSKVIDVAKPVVKKQLGGKKEQKGDSNS